MSETNRLAHTPDCYIKIYVTAGCSRLETSFATSKEIRIMISINSITDTNTSYKNLFQEFYRQLLGYKVIEFVCDVESIPNNIQNQFRTICDQVINLVPKYQILDAENNKIFPTTKRIQHTAETITRFVENRLNAVREIVIQDENNTDIPIEQLDMPIEHKISNIQQMRNCRPSQADKIDEIVNVIYKNIKSRKSKNPDFNKKTKAQYRKIKNYVRGITGVYLSVPEIKILSGKIIPLLNQSE